MRNFILYSLLSIICIGVADAAVTIKKAEPVATQSSAGTQGAASLVPNLIGLVSGVMEMNAKQNQLSADCVPTTAEMNFVDNTMKEWAKTGRTTAENVRTLLRRDMCGNSTGLNCYSSDAAFMSAAGMTPRYDVFRGPGNEGMVWKDFPKTGKGTYCKNGAPTCMTRDQTTVTDTYDLFALIDFEPQDYIPAEATMAARLISKMETCSTVKLSEKKKELWGNFLVSTAGSLGQQTNTGSIMDTVGNVIQGGPSGGLGSIGAIAQQFLNK